MVLKLNPEFAYELILALPYAFWLHNNGMLEKVITSKDMKPFYYFCDNVEEVFNERTINNSVSGINTLPNIWPHHNCMSILNKGYGECSTEEQESVNGVLDYKQWTPPLYKDYYSLKNIDIPKPYVVVNNIFNITGNGASSRFFDIPTLNSIFNYLIELGYTVIYKRPDNTEFPIDENEYVTIKNNILLRSITDMGILSDYDLCDLYEGKVINLNKLKKDYNNISYNEFQLKVFSEASYFITVNGGGGVLCAYFGKTVIIYVPEGKELRPGYLTNKDCYMRRLSNAKIFPIYSNEIDSFKIGYDTNKIMNVIKQVIL